MTSWPRAAPVVQPFRAARDSRELPSSCGVKIFVTTTHDVFGETAAHRPPPSPLRRPLTIFSVVLHAIIIAVTVLAQVLAVGPLPLPRQPMLFEELRLIHLADIRVPSPPRRSTGPRSGNVSQDVAPMVEPTGITAETGLEKTSIGHGPPGSLHGVESGIAIIDSVGKFEAVAPPVSPPSPVHLHRGIEAPKKIKDATPVYPPLARSAGVQGVVILEAIIDADGNVTSVQVLRSIPLLDQAAVDAVRQWKYTPALLNGKAVPVIVTVTVSFSLKR
jgi:periplasmic protein TonB